MGTVMAPWQNRVPCCVPRMGSCNSKELKANNDFIFINPSLLIGGCSPPKVMIPQQTQQHHPINTQGVINMGPTLDLQQSLQPQTNATESAKTIMPEAQLKKAKTQFPTGQIPSNSIIPGIPCNHPLCLSQRRQIRQSPESPLTIPGVTKARNSADRV